ncbi:MAG: transposase [Acidobacteria bacterium]|nr:transposase [Acidobacteriota bacterium]
MKQKQLTLMDAMLTLSRRKKTSRAVGTLESIGKLVDWEALVKIVEQLDRTREGRGGRPPVSFEVKLKMLFLQHAFNLSDEELEDQLADRLSFQQFVGLGYDEEIPDFTTFWKFKEKLVKAGLMQKIFEQILSQIDERGLILKRGNDHRRDAHPECEPADDEGEAGEGEGEPAAGRGRGGNLSGREETLRLQGPHRYGRGQQDHPQVRTDAGERSRPRTAARDDERRRTERLGRQGISYSGGQEGGAGGRNILRSARQGGSGDTADESPETEEREEIQSAKGGRTCVRIHEEETESNGDGGQEHRQEHAEIPDVVYCVQRAESRLHTQAEVRLLNENRAKSIAKIDRNRRECRQNPKNRSETGAKDGKNMKRKRPTFKKIKKRNRAAF